MHPSKFFSEVEFIRPTDFYSTICTEEIKETMKQIHPSQLITSRVKIPMWEIRFAYDTVRGNRREHKKYCFGSYYEESDMMIEMSFNDYVEEYNKKHPYRKMLNVNILSITPLAHAVLQIG